MRGFSVEKYPKGFHFLGFTIKPSPYKVKGIGVVKSIPCFCASQKLKSSILEKFREMNLHKRRSPLEQIAKDINPVLRGIINYYHHFWKDDMHMVWNQLNANLLK